MFYCFLCFTKKQQTEKPWTTLGAGVSEPQKVLQTVKISEGDSLPQKSPYPIHPAIIPQFSRKFLTNCVQSRKNRRKSAFFRDDAGRYGTHSHLLEISLRAIARGFKSHRLRQKIVGSYYNCRLFSLFFGSSDG